MSILRPGPASPTVGFALVSRSRVIQVRITSGGAERLVVVGGPGVMSFPSGRCPSPASGRLGSWPFCVPNCAVEKLTDVVSLATQPSIGTTTAICAPLAWVSSIQPSSVELPSLTFSKNQSLAVFQALSSQFKRDIGLPPTRCAVSPVVHSPCEMP